jgi:YVTN family beta-propeller protein
MHEVVPAKITAAGCASGHSLPPVRGFRRVFALTVALALALPVGLWSQGCAAEALPFELEAKIPLGPVTGRIDHLTFDPKRKRLLVAELGNGSVAVADLADRKVIHTISGLKDPQGIAYVPSADMVYVASGGDRSVRLYRAADYGAAGRIDLGDDADNVRVDAAANRVYVGYGKGALAEQPYLDRGRSDREGGSGVGPIPAGSRTWLCTAGKRLSDQAPDC